MAVIVVVAFHAGLGRAQGGFIGVDVFFVLSGFLITGLLVREAERSGRIDLVGFWFRRVRRLVPAALLTIVVTGVLFSFVAAVPERSSVIADGRSSALWYANWHFIAAAQDYFRTDSNASPFLHFWSLSIEEQFYAVWPLVVFGAVSLKPARRVLRSTSVIVAVPLIAAAYSVARAGQSPTRSYYASDTRVYQLLAGAALAIVLRRMAATRPSDSDTTDRAPSLRNRRLILPGAELAVVVVGMAWLVVDADLSQRFRGVAATVWALFALCLLVPQSPLYVNRSQLERVLAVRPMVQIGRISYGVYLWHWPIIVLLLRTFQVGAMTVFVFAMLASLGCAAGSWMFVEQPIQRMASRIHRPRFRSGAVLGALSSSLIVALVALPIALSDRVPLLDAAARPGFGSSSVVGAGPVLPLLVTNTPVPADLGLTPVNLAFPENIGCINRVPTSAEDCIAVDSGRDGGAPTENGPKVLILGDSHAHALASAFIQEAFETGGIVATVSLAGCPWQSTLLFGNEQTRTSDTVCADARDAMLNIVIPEFDPDVVVLIGQPFFQETWDVIRADGADGGDDREALVRTATTEALAELVAPGRDVVLMLPTPTSPFDPQVCLSAVDRVELCSYSVLDDLAAEHDALTAAAAPFAGSPDGSVRVVSIEDLVCPRTPVCDAIVDGTLVRYDPSHLYDGFVQHIRPQLMARVLSAR